MACVSKSSSEPGEGAKARRAGKKLWARGDAESAEENDGVIPAKAGIH
jgi:hypothetical protein